MRRRFLALTLALAVIFAGAGEARAHRLKAACRFLPGRVVQVETWFDRGPAPKKGHVQVRAADGHVLLEGQLNREGLFQFDAPEGQALQVVVEAGDGHRAEVAIRPEQVLVGSSPGEAAPKDQPAVADPRHLLSRDEPFPIKDMLTGVGLLIAVAALALSLRNARSIRELKQPRP